MPDDKFRSLMCLSLSNTVPLVHSKCQYKDHQPKTGNGTDKPSSELKEMNSS